MPHGQVNAEESVLPLRTVVIIFVFLLGLFASAATGIFIGTQQWDKTQANISGLTDATNKLTQQVASLAEQNLQLTKANVDFTNSVAQKSHARDLQIDALNGRIDTVAKAQSDAHDETITAIQEIHNQLKNIVADLAVLKCKVIKGACGPS